MSQTITKGPVAKLPTKYGLFNIVIFKDDKQLDHAVIYMGDLTTQQPVLCRIHSECLTGDALGSLRCDCGFQLAKAFEKIASAGRGAILYMRQEGRGIGLFNKIRAYELQDNGLDTVDANLQLHLPADGRQYGICAQIMHSMGFDKVVLMTNNPAKIEDLKQHGIDVVDRMPIETGRNPYNESYLDTKQQRMGHILKHDNNV